MAEPTEAEILLGELTANPSWRVFVEYLVAPRVNEIREQLLKNSTLDQTQRVGYVLLLTEIERLLSKPYEHVEPSELPDRYKNLFR